MEVIDIIGYISAIVIGLVLGLIGGGGSILTVPVLVYLLGIEPLIATAYSLFIVGVTALVGAIRNLQKGLVELKTAVVFSLPAFTAVYLTRKYFLPAIPDVLLQWENHVLTKNMGIMLFFAIIMLLAALSMIRSGSSSTKDSTGKKGAYPLIVVEGFGVGVLTGLVGAGGGFLIIPALVLLGGLPMKRAVATSLLIIAVKSLIGFIGDVENMVIDWFFLLPFAAFSIIGIFLGVGISKRIDGKRLKKAFGWFVLIMAVYILYKEGGF
jgi:uncharacterized membrane protein YfcA